MKKVLFVLAFVAVYGVSMAMSGQSVAAVANDTEVAFVSGIDNDNIVAPEGEDEKEKKEGKKGKSTKTKSCSDSKASDCNHSKAKSCCDSKAKSSCSEAAKTSCSEEKK